MKNFSERNPLVVGAIGVVVVAGVVVASLSYSKLPFFKSSKEYSAYFAEAGGLLPGTAVQVSGFKAGKVDTIALDGARVLVKFEVDKHIRLGDRTEASIKTKSLLGAKSHNPRRRQAVRADSARAHDGALPAARRAR